jgi:glycosyltransferase involved in cell wall biosynthesis
VHHPTVSCVIPCYNASATLAEALRSVYSQALPVGATFEVIISDDGSSDDYASIAAAFPGVQLLRSSTNTGPAGARNRGLRAATGEFVCFLDADDQYAPGFLENTLSVLQQNAQWAGVMTGVELVNCHRSVHPVQLHAIACSVPSNLLLRRPVVDLLGGFPEGEAFRGPIAGEDTVFKQVLSIAFHVGYLPHPFLRHHVRPGSHFDLFLDRSTVVDGKLVFASHATELEVAGRGYLKTVRARIDAVLACLRPV